MTEQTTEPGRNERGEWLSNDATAGQAFEALACAITCALRAAGTWEPAEKARLIRQGFANLVTARDAAELMDAGQRPATEEAGAAGAESQVERG